MAVENEFPRRIERIETLIQEIERFADPAAQAHARELVQALLDLHGAGLAQMLELIEQTDHAGRSIIESFVRDDLISSLLLLYGLHPVGLESRIQAALETVRPYLRSHGGNVELLSVDEGVVRLRMQGSCHGCPSSAVTLKLAIEEAVYGAAPDVTDLQVEGVVEAPAPSRPMFVPLGQVITEIGPLSEGGAGWEDVDDLADLPEGSVQVREVAGRLILFCLVGETYYAYGHECPSCGQSLGEVRLKSTILTCVECGQRFDILRAGRGLDEPELHLEPFPLLTEHGRVKVALPFVSR